MLSGEANSVTVFLHASQSLSHDPKCSTLPHLTVTLSVGEPEHALPHFSQKHSAAILEPHVSSINVSVRYANQCGAAKLLLANDMSAKSQEEEEKARRVTSLPLMCWGKQKQQHSKAKNSRKGGNGIIIL